MGAYLVYKASSSIVVGSTHTLRVFTNRAPAKRFLYLVMRVVQPPAVFIIHLSSLYSKDL